VFFLALTLPQKLKQTTAESFEDDLLYDKVPSDEDYASVASETITLTNKTELLANAKQQNNGDNNMNQKFISQEHKIVELKTNFDKPLRFTNSSNGSSPSSSKLVTNAELTLNSILSTLENTTKPAPVNLIESIDSNDSNLKKLYEDLKNENDLMKTMVHNLLEENAQLRIDKMLLTTSASSTSTMLPIDDQFGGLYSTINLSSKNNSSSTKPYHSSSRTSPGKNSPIIFANPGSDRNHFKTNLNEAKNNEQILKIEFKKNKYDDLNRLKFDLSDSDFEFKKTELAIC
jgi:hypothetical protein